MRYAYLILFCFVVFQTEAQTRADMLMQQLTDRHSSKILTVSHRGDWRNAPENSLQAIQNCIEMGVDMVEIDLKRTKDGHLILMHDKTIDRTTTGKGKPEDYTLEELKRFNLRNGAGHKTSHSIATLEEAMNLAKNRILVNIDKGYDYFDDVYTVLEKTGTTNQCIIKSDKTYDTVMLEHPIALDKMIFMPVVKLSNPNANQIIADYKKNYNPIVYEIVFDNDSEQTLSIINDMAKGDSKLFVNSLWPELCGGHDDDRAIEQNDISNSWEWLINIGVNLIQTDRPAALINYLNNRTTK